MIDLDWRSPPCAHCGKGQVYTSAGFWCQDCGFDDQQEKKNVEREMAEELCTGHVASASDPKVCAHCGVHIDSLRPPDDEK